MNILRGRSPFLRRDHAISTPKALRKIAQGCGAAATLGDDDLNHDSDPNGVAERTPEPFQGSPVCTDIQPRVAAAPQPWAMLRNRFAVGTQLRGFLFVACVLLTGCGQELDTLYGQRRGSGAETSVNGTSVFSGMCARADHKVYGSMSLSPRLAERADCIVWFPNDFEPPTPEVRKWFQDWLIAQPGRTLIYVGRDYDAARWYWKKNQPDTPDELQAELQRRMSEAAGDFSTARQAIPQSEDCLWFTVEAKYQQRDVRSLKGDPAWVAGIDPAQLEIELCGRMKPSEYAEVLVESEGDMLLSREPFDESQLLVVANGSFLLNLPLVNHEHRKLAGKLIDAIGPAGAKGRVPRELCRRAAHRGRRPHRRHADRRGNLLDLADQLDSAASGDCRHSLLFLAVSDPRRSPFARAAGASPISAGTSPPSPNCSSAAETGPTPKPAWRSIVNKPRWTKQRSESTEGGTYPPRSLTAKPQAKHSTLWQNSPRREEFKTPEP